MTLRPRAPRVVVILFYYFTRVGTGCTGVRTGTYVRTYVSPRYIYNARNSGHETLAYVCARYNRLGLSCNDNNRMAITAELYGHRAAHVLSDDERYTSY